MSEFYDDLETRSPETRETAQAAALSDLLAHARSRSPLYRDRLPERTPSGTASEALRALPVLRKSELIPLQKETPPFGGIADPSCGAFGNVFLSPGPISQPGGNGSDRWRMARALHAAGFRRGDFVHNCFSYHFTPAGMMMDSGARSLGCVVFPGGIAQTEMQVEAIARYGAIGYCGTPDFLKVILEKAADVGVELSSLRKALVSGGALVSSLREEYEQCGVSVRQCYGTADLGLIAYESSATDGLIVDEGVIVEIVRPGTGDPVPVGEVGEVVVTTLNPDYPLIRFATGDLSAVLKGQSPCGRTGMRIEGWMGRADQTTKVRGMFVHPEQIDRVVKRHPEIERARLLVSSRDGLDQSIFRCEVAGAAVEGLAAAIATSFHAECKVRGQVEFCTPGELPNDGKVIEDVRTRE